MTLSKNNWSEGDKQLYKYIKKNISNMGSKIILYTTFIIINILNMFIIENTDNFHLLIWIFMIFSCGLFILNFEFSLKKSFLQLFLLFFLFMSHTLVPVLAKVGFLKININTLNVQNNLSIYLYITFFIFFFFFNKIWDHSSPQKTKKYIVISKKWIYIFFICIFLLSGISYILGLSKMGFNAIVLPFKLAGIINTLRISLAPFLFVILFDKIKERTTKRFLVSIVILFFIWSIFEAFLRLSRSALIEYFIPFILYNIFCFNFSFYRILKYVLPLIILNIVFYSIITNLRNINDKVTFATIQQANNSILEKKNGEIYLRIFGNVRFIEKYIPYLSKDKFFSFHNLPEIISYKGSHNFTTVIVDNLGLIQETHSSGTTGISDVLLIGGSGFTIITFAMISIFCFYFDSKKMQNNFLLRLFGFTIVRWLVMLKSWSLLFSFVEIFPFLLLYLLIRKL